MLSFLAYGLARAVRTVFDIMGSTAKNVDDQNHLTSTNKLLPSHNIVTTEFDSLPGYDVVAIGNESSVKSD